MSATQFNPVSKIINLIIGWFFLSFLHALVLTFIFRSKTELMASFMQIALFKDLTASLINVGLIVGLGLLGTLIWLIVKRRT